MTIKELKEAIKNIPDDVEIMTLGSFNVGDNINNVELYTKTDPDGNQTDVLIIS